MVAPEREVAGGDQRRAGCSPAVTSRAPFISPVAASILPRFMYLLGRSRGASRRIAVPSRSCP